MNFDVPNVDWIKCKVATLLLALISVGTMCGPGATPVSGDEPASKTMRFKWSSLPDLPNDLGVAGPFVGVHNDALIVAGGANFPLPVWDSQKAWTDQIWVLRKAERGMQWLSGGDLLKPLAYGAAVSTELGVVCIGGNDANRLYREVFALQWDSTSQKVIRTDLPSLRVPFAYGQATVIDKVLYVAGGQSGPQLELAMNQLWSLDLSQQSESVNDPANNQSGLSWRELPAIPSSVRAFNITAQQDNGEETCVYVIGGRFQRNDQAVFLSEVWEFSPKHQAWRRRADAPRPISAGTGIGVGQNDILVLSGDDGALFTQTEQLKDQHPGFRKEALCFNAKTNTWSSAGTTPQNQVTTNAVLWDDRILLPSGEIRPRVRTPAVWSIERSSADER